MNGQNFITMTERKEVCEAKLVELNLMFCETGQSEGAPVDSVTNSELVSLLKPLQANIKVRKDRIS